ncbi:MAG: gephyrin-like molybdotransferase Glp [Persicimonas sp.]
MITVDEALNLLTEHISPLEAERIGIQDALYRVAAEQMAAGIELPPFAQSAMDGYAVRAGDLADASQDRPVTLEVVGEVAAGESGALPTVELNQTVRVFTGGRIPPGADAVVRQECVGRDEGRAIFVDPVDAGRDIRRVGEELHTDRVLVEEGERVDERHIAALSMTGHAELLVRCRPRITLLVSGDEVVAPGNELQAGQVYDANLPFLAGWLQARGYESFEILRLPDDREVVQRGLDEALGASDLVVSTGGVSVGDYDFFGEATDDLGLEKVFWKVRQKPGKPLLFARRAETPFLGLPGNPGAVFVAAYIYLRRALDLLEGARPAGPAMQTGVLAAPIGLSKRRLNFAGCALDFDAQGRAMLSALGSHRLGTLYRADAIARIPEGDGELPAGTAVQWLPL